MEKKLKTLSKEQIEELKKFKILTKDSLSEFIFKHKISFCSIKRRLTALKIKIPYGYSYHEYLANPQLQSPYNKNNIYINCSCGKDYITVIHGFYKRKYKDPVCDICYRKHFLYDSSWRENNRKAQLIAQNKLETLEKQISSQKKRFKDPQLIKKYQEIGKKLWEDKNYRFSVLSKCSKSKHGTYNGIFYQSGYELAFIIRCQKDNMRIQNYQGSGIPYYYENKLHHYYPDFIVNDNLIVEVKGTGGFYDKFIDKNIEKLKALTKWCKENNFGVRMVLDYDLGNRAIKEAKKIHDSLNSKNNNSI